MSMQPIYTQQQQYLTKHRVKQLSSWFSTWYTWQRRVFVCRLMEHCSRDQFELLATALEPLLHLDFSSLFAPHLQALHLDGSVTFQVRRMLAQSDTNLPSNSWISLPSLPTTFESSLADSTSTETGKILNADATITVASTSTETGQIQDADATITVTSTSTETGQIQDADATITHPASQQSLRSHSKLKAKETVILPALPLTHVRHATQSFHAETSIEDVLALRRSRFSSVPDFRSTANILKHVRQKELFRGPTKDHHRSKSFRAATLPRRVKQKRGRQAELFKSQLADLSKWMGDSESTQKAFIAFEVVKLCDKDLLGYFVQCLYQRLLQEKRGVESLPDSILIKIFSFMDPTSLCRAAQASRQWNRVASAGCLWKHHCYQLGKQEGVGDLSKAMEIASGLTSTLTEVRLEESEGHSAVDWKLVYRELSMLMSQIKELILKRVNDKMETQLMEEFILLTKSSVSIKQNFTLQEMLQILENKCVKLGTTGPMTTQDLIHSAPESPATIRRRQRMENAEREKMEMESKLFTRYEMKKGRDITSGLAYRFGHMVLSSPLENENPRMKESIKLIEVALDSRPAVSHLPNTKGLECLVLSGCLNMITRSKPGKVQSIPLLRRVDQQPDQTIVYCLQCDQKKIMLGTDNMEIVVHDIRTGRPIKTLSGHKGSVQCIQYDSFKIVSGSWDTTCMVWDAVHFELIKELRGHKDCVSCLQFDQDKLVTGSYDKSLRVWNTLTWHCVTVIGNAHSGPITCMQFNHWAIVSGSMDQCVKLWSPSTYQHIATLNHDAPITAIKLSNFLLITASLTGDILMWNLETRTLLIQLEELKGVGNLSMMTVSKGRLFGAASNGVIYEWDISTGICVRTLTGHSRRVTSLWVGHNIIVSAGEDRTVCVWYSKKALAKELTINGGNYFFMQVPIVQSVNHS